MKETGLETGSLTQKLKENISVYQLVFNYNMIRRIGRMLRQVVTEVINIDKAMVNQRKLPMRLLIHMTSF